MVLMEPNAVAGMTNRWMGRFVARALVNFPADRARSSRAARRNWTGLPVREEFFSIAPKPPGRGPDSAGHRRQPGIAPPEPGRAGELAVVPRRGPPGPPAAPDRPRGARRTGVGVRRQRPRGRGGSVHRRTCPRLSRRPTWWSAAPAREPCRNWRPRASPPCWCRFRSRRTSTSCATRKRWSRAGAARLVADAEMTGQSLFEEVSALAAQAGGLERMGRAARALARPGAAARAADILEELAGKADFALTAAEKAETIQ